jgi:hypothetical protein
MMMSTNESNLERQWVDTWQKAGLRLEAVHREELRAFRYEEHMKEVDDLLEIACRYAQERTTSGLVEQQRIFQKTRSALTGSSE